MYNISDNVSQEIKQIYNEHKELISSIYLTGSCCLPFDFKCRDTDLWAVVVNEEAGETLKSALNLIDGHKLKLESGETLDIRIRTKEETLDFPLNIWAFEFHYMNQAKQIAGKKFNFKCKLDTNRANYIKLLLEFIEQPLIVSLLKVKNQPRNIQYKDIYYFIFGACIIMNNSYDNFTRAQKYLIKVAHDKCIQPAELATFIEDFKEYLQIEGIEE